MRGWNSALQCSFFTATCTFKSWNSTAMNTNWQLHISMQNLIKPVVPSTCAADVKSGSEDRDRESWPERIQKLLVEYIIEMHQTRCVYLPADVCLWFLQLKELDLDASRFGWMQKDGDKGGLGGGGREVGVKLLVCLWYLQLKRAGSRCHPDVDGCRKMGTRGGERSGRV
jgi:hypothetical protein